MIDVMYQVTALASVIVFSVGGLVARRWIGRADARRQERRR